jgi:hypothetical protein
MEQFDRVTVTAMRTALDEVCRHIPSQSTTVRAFIATRILESARQGERTLDGLKRAGRRAVIDQFGSTDAAMRAWGSSVSR